MRTRDKRRIVKLFLEGWSVPGILGLMWLRIRGTYTNPDRMTIESIIREYAIESDARAARREKRRKG